MICLKLLFIDFKKDLKFNNKNIIELSKEEAMIKYKRNVTKYINNII